jgi:uncharacterized membrane protein YhaH (DUF805 family)
MDFIYLFTSFDGRINRAKWWAGELILLVIFFAGALIGNQTTIGQTTAASLIWLVLYLPKYPLAAKRFQDRDKPGNTALYGYIPSVIAVLILIFGPVLDNPQTRQFEIGGVVVSYHWNTNILGSICFIALIGIMVWFLIELGMLSGTPGANRFGPDPLTRTDAKLQPSASPTE